MRPRRVAVLAHYDPDGLVAPHVRRTIEAVAEFVDHLTVVSTADLVLTEREWIEERCTLIMRANVGHDFASYRVGIERLDLSSVDELVMMNDSAVFPLIPLAQIFRDVSSAADFWGITEGFGFEPHIQSYFVVFRRAVLKADTFEFFWRGVDLLERGEVVKRYEVGLSQALLQAGLEMATYFRPSPWERLQGAARAHRNEGLRYLRKRRPRKVLGWVKRTIHHARRPEWNISAALPDRALGTNPRLPMVKISVLREDPYHLGTERLLTACERRHPEAFAGVRDYLRRTDSGGDRGFLRP